MQSVFPVPSIGIHEWAPYAILLVAALVVLLVDCFLPNKRRILPFLSVLGMLAAGASIYSHTLPKIQFFQGLLIGDMMARLGSLLVLFAGIATVLVSKPNVEARRINPGEYHALVLFAVFGMTMLCASQELLTIFLNIEILSLALYVLAGADRRDPRALEAGFKYFILGSIASAFIVLGSAFLFGATGSTTFSVIQERLQNNAMPTPVGNLSINALWVYIGACLLFAGMAFKLSLAPFHMWAPDVYAGAPTPISMLIATAAKVGAFIVMIRLVEAVGAFGATRAHLGTILAALAIVSAAWGNLAALVQKDLKRLLAYSSVAHGGYMMVGIAAAGFATDATDLANVRTACLVYLLGYTLMKVLAFGVIAALGPGAELPIDEWRGLARKRGLLAAGIALALVSLTGIPPTIGFFGKFYVFQVAVQMGLLGLALAAILFSVISAYYYLRIVVVLFMEERTDGSPIPGDLLGTISSGGVVTLALASALIFFFGILPMWFLAL